MVARFEYRMRPVAFKVQYITLCESPESLAVCRYLQARCGL